jgi:hypothetical protein
MNLSLFARSLAAFIKSIQPPGGNYAEVVGYRGARVVHGGLKKGK